MTLGQHITALRKGKDFSHSELGKRVGTSVDIVGRYERDEVKPSIDIAKRLADVFEVSLDYLAGSAEQSIDKATLNRLNDINHLEPSDKNLVYAFLDSFITKAKLQSVLR
ncbi:MAG: helix-turn-helix transcriptional regulator [Salinivirgaceae bacterium]|nr:helix-turn-helix transcriptional regulator [Salinivirgaceae bacterium]